MFKTREKSLFYDINHVTFRCVAFLIMHFHSLVLQRFYSFTTNCNFLSLKNYLLNYHMCNLLMGNFGCDILVLAIIVYLNHTHMRIACKLCSTS